MSDFKRLQDVQTAYTEEYLSGEDGVYSVAIAREDDLLFIRVSADEERIPFLPKTFMGEEIRYRVGGPGITLQGRSNA